MSTEGPCRAAPPSSARTGNSTPSDEASNTDTDNMDYCSLDTFDEVLREQYDDYAARLGGRWSPTPWQGCNSYTLCDSQKGEVLQFRGTNEALNEEITGLAERVHSTLAPRTRCLGRLSTAPPVVVWKMELKKGDPYLFHVQSFGQERISVTVTDLAK
jgi:hypothetical protein